MDEKKNMMREIKDRTDNISEFEKTMTGMKFEMTEVKINMNNMTDALSKIVDESRKKRPKIRRTHQKNQ